MSDAHLLDTDAQAWLDALAAQPDAALDALLMGEAWLGAYAAQEPAQALPQFLPVAHEDTLDSALLNWLSCQLRQNTLPPEATPKQYALALTQAGVSREDAYAAVQENAMKVWRGEGAFLDDD